MPANIDSIIQKVRRYNPDADTALLRRALDYATKKHEGQKRKTGEPYIIHPIEVVDILAGLEMDTPSLAAGFLHDVIEDCGVTFDDLSAEFGPEIAGLVDGVTKLKLADFERRDAAVVAASNAAVHPKDEPISAVPDPRRKKRMETRSSAENLRKILLAMAKDFRVMVIKLGDRLHNMRTLQGLSEERRKKVAEETMQIFAPLAHRLGIWQVKWQLEDLAFKNLYPAEYQELTDRIARTRRAREKDIKDSIYRLRDGFAAAEMEVEIQGRPKHLWSIFNKMQKQELDLGDIYDMIALRIIVGDRADENETPEAQEARQRKALADCYAAVGVVHTVFMPIPGKFDDYIAKKKANLYQSIHTKVYGPRDEPLEVQIRTWDMHRIAEFGVAAHWAYKEKGEEARAGADFDRKMSFLRQQLFDWQQDTRDSTEFLRSVISDLFTDQVFVFTPKGDVIDLPAGATPVDFAFRIHSDVGEHMVAAKVNGRIVPISYQFRNGDIASIVTRPQAAPSLDWLLLAKSSHARTKIKHHFRKLRYGENVLRGRDMLHEELVRLGLAHEILRDNKRMLPLANTLNKESVDDLYAAVGFGDTALGVVINRIRAELTPQEQGEKRIERKPTGGKLSITPGGVDGVAIVRAKCCLPLPGDEVIGYVSRGKGISLHREGCPNMGRWRTTEPERLMEIDWQPAEASRFETGVVIETLDRVGLLRDVTEIFSENRTFILGIHTRSDVIKGTAILRIDFESASTAHIANLVKKLQSLNDLLSIHRLGVGADEPTVPSVQP